MKIYCVLGDEGSCYYHYKNKEDAIKKIVEINKKSKYEECCLGEFELE